MSLLARSGCGAARRRGAPCRRKRQSPCMSVAATPAGRRLAIDAERPCTSTAHTATKTVTGFSPQEQTYLDDIVARRTTSFPRPAWMQRHRATAISAKARRLIGASPSLPRDNIRPSDTAYYHAAARVRILRGHGHKIHQAGPDGHPICSMGEGLGWEWETGLGAGPVTCGKCAGPAAPNPAARPDPRHGRLDTAEHCESGARRPVGRTVRHPQLHGGRRNARTARSRSAPLCADERRRARTARLSR